MVALHAQPPLLLVFEGKPDLLIGRVCGVLGHAPLRQRELRPAPAHLLIVRPLCLRICRHRDPLRIEVPVVQRPCTIVAA